MAKEKKARGEAKVGERKWRVFWELKENLVARPEEGDLSLTQSKDVSAPSRLEAVQKVLESLEFKESEIADTYYPRGGVCCILIQSQNKSLLFYCLAYPICKCCGGKGVITGKYNI